jgi:hypothetical protein
MRGFSGGAPPGESSGGPETRVLLALSPLPCRRGACATLPPAGPSLGPSLAASELQVFMMWRPAARLAIGPFPPFTLDDRFLAATILAPRVLFAMFLLSRPRLLDPLLKPS